MSRTIDEIKKEIVDVFESQPIVKAKYRGNGIKKVSVENVLFYAVAYGLWVFEQFLEMTKMEIENTVTNKMYGTVGWWHGKVLAWQYGDSTVVKGGTVTYEVVDVEKQLVKQVAVVPKDREIQIKVAKANGEELAALTAEELSMLKNYVQEVKPAGLVANVDSNAADEITLAVDVYYNGELLAEVIESGVKTAVNSYLRALPFNGDIYRNKVIDYIQGVQGVNDCVVNGFSIRAYTGKTVDVARVYSPVSGHYKVSSLTINLVAE